VAVPVRERSGPLFGWPRGESQMARVVKDLGGNGAA
jgi:hypothetical protein